MKRFDRFLIRMRHSAMAALNTLDAMTFPWWKSWLFWIFIWVVHVVPMLLYHWKKMWGNRDIEQDWNDLNTVSEDVCYRVTDRIHRHNWIKEGF